jgi:integrase
MHLDDRDGPSVNVRFGSKGWRRALSGRADPEGVERVKEAFGARKVWWHLLRHTAATSLLCGWWGRRLSLDEVAKMLGHSSVKVTERYAQLLDSERSKLAAETHA